VSYAVSSTEWCIHGNYLFFTYFFRLTCTKNLRLSSLLQVPYVRLLSGYFLAHISTSIPLPEAYCLNNGPKSCLTLVPHSLCGPSYLPYCPVRTPSRHQPVNNDEATFLATGMPLLSHPPTLNHREVSEISYVSWLNYAGFLKMLDGLSSRPMFAITSTYFRCFMSFMRQLLRHLMPKSPFGPAFLWNSSYCFYAGVSDWRLHMK